MPLSGWGLRRKIERNGARKEKLEGDAGGAVFRRCHVPRPAGDTNRRVTTRRGGPTPTGTRGSRRASASWTWPLVASTLPLRELIRPSRNAGHAPARLRDDQRAGRRCPTAGASVPRSRRSARRRRSRDRSPPSPAAARRARASRNSREQPDELVRIAAARRTGKPVTSSASISVVGRRHAQRRAVQPRARPRSAVNSSLPVRIVDRPRPTGYAVDLERERRSRRSAGRARSWWCRRSDRTPSRTPATRRARRRRTPRRAR